VDVTIGTSLGKFKRLTKKGGGEERMKYRACKEGRPRPTGWEKKEGQLGAKERPSCRDSSDFNGSERKERGKGKRRKAS